MIKSIYILNENGILLYSKNFLKEKYDHNILIGFFSSISNFSREALGSVVKNVDLGENNKLILVTHPEERLLGATIVNASDNNELVTLILNNIIQDFIDIFSPDYNPEKIFPNEMEKIINQNLRGKVMHSPLIRISLSWLIVGPLSYILTFLSINATLFIYLFFNLNQFYTPDQLFTRFLPSLIALSTTNMMILFLFPNLILGYLAPNRKIALVNSFIYFAITIIIYFSSAEPNFAYIIIGDLPLILIFSLFFLFIGIRYSSKRFLRN